MNNYGGQVGDAPLSDFISRARPDMISFDTYPYRHAAPNNPARIQPAGGSPINWYSDLRRYREHAKGANIPLGLYRQTYHSVTEGVRDVSDSELRLMTFGALSFNAKYLTDFTYNTGASSFFNNQLGGDNSPNTLYTQAQAINRDARNLGKAMVRLTPVADAAGAGHTTSMMLIRGSHRGAGGAVVRNWSNGDGSDNVQGYTGFTRDPSSVNYTDWEFGRNDPYLSGPFNDAGTQNLSGFNEGLDGDVFISWFKPLDEAFDGDQWNNQIYIMVSNGLADMDATGAQTQQRIKLNFGSSAVQFPYDHLQKLDRLTGEIVDVPLAKLNANVWQLDMVLDGGTADLFKFPTGAPFVGVQPVPEPASFGLVALCAMLMGRRKRAAGK